MSYIKETRECPNCHKVYSFFWLKPDGIFMNVPPQGKQIANTDTFFDHIEIYPQCEYCGKRDVIYKSK